MRLWNSACRLGEMFSKIQTGVCPDIKSSLFAKGLANIVSIILLLYITLWSKNGANVNVSLVGVERNISAVYQRFKGDYSHYSDMRYMHAVPVWAQGIHLVNIAQTTAFGSLLEDESSCFLSSLQKFLSIKYSIPYKKIILKHTQAAWSLDTEEIRTMDSEWTVIKINLILVTI